ncbi:hypothetical protein TNCV_529561 [Trichonephila clavipes]|nr:hypothetical protein TNCV_529561 [Trichonephila clavipes]
MEQPRRIFQTFKHKLSSYLSSRILSDPINFRLTGTKAPVTSRAKSADASDIQFWLLYLEKRIINEKVLLSTFKKRIRIRLISFNKEPLSSIAFDCTQKHQLVVLISSLPTP